MEPRSPNLPKESSTWLKSKEQKKILIDKFMSIYGNDLTGKIDIKAFLDPTARIAEKHIALSVMRILNDKDDVWVMPIGRIFPAPDKLPSNDSKPMQNSDTAISRFQSVIVYDRKTGGMCIFDFGIFGCELQHSGQECRQRYGTFPKIGNSPSYQLAMRLLDSATKDLTDPVHEQLYEDFAKLRALAEEATATTSSNMSQVKKLGLDKDTTRIQSGFPSKGCELVLIPPNDLPSQAFDTKDAAFVRRGDELWYINKVTFDKILIPTTKESLAAVDREMQPANKARTLSENELKRMIAITGFTPPEYQPELIIGVIPLLPEQQDLNLIFGPSDSMCRLAISSSAIQPFADIKPAPAYLCDPLTGKLLKNPVTTPLGKTYERESIENYIKINHKDPDSGQPLQINQLIPNLNLKYVLEKYKSDQSGASSSKSASQQRPTFFDPASREKEEESEREEEPDYLCCPISGEIMQDPKMTPNGKTYDSQSIAQWIDRQHTDPVTGKPLTTQDLRPNLALKAAIEDWENAPAQRVGHPKGP